MALLTLGGRAIGKSHGSSLTTMSMLGSVPNRGSSGSKCVRPEPDSKAQSMTQAL